VSPHPIARPYHVPKLRRPVHVKPDPNAVFESRCARCDGQLIRHGCVGLECDSCIAEARKVWPDAQPIGTEIGGE
jgi:hypothetical protein